jgi:hypothetical protein
MQLSMAASLLAFHAFAGSDRIFAGSCYSVLDEPLIRPWLGDEMLEVKDLREVMA